MKIKYLAMDVDGTLTDGKIYMSPQGEAMKAFNIKDGYGIHDILIPAGIVPVIITGRSSDIVRRRCDELGITEVYQNATDKLKVLSSLVPDLSCVAYIGDDNNDLKVMRFIKEAGGFVGCPEDASDSVKEIADFIAPHKGGEGAVRDYIEWVVSKD